MVSMKEAREVSGTAVRGNVNPTKTVMEGTVEEVLKEANEVLEETRGMTGIVLGTGCDVPPAAPNENVKALTIASQCFDYELGKGDIGCHL